VRGSTVSSPALVHVVDACADLGLDVRPIAAAGAEDRLILRGPSGESISVDLRFGRLSMIEQVLRSVQVDFVTLPLLVRGDSKEIRLLTPRIALTRLLPTVYSFTFNRYGVVPGTDEVRARFSAELFRQMAAEPGASHLPSAFLGLVESPVGPLLAEEVVETCNLEVRVKRFHIGSPVHRYRYVEAHRTAFGRMPLQRWSRFEQPVVCFDWRHPLHDKNGVRLADEPLSDDYAAMWIDSVSRAKALVRRTFEWIERRFANAGLQLVDICFFVDRTGSVLYGEISPDCMRVRSHASADAEALDKDHWRSGGEPSEVLARYRRLHELVFGRLDVNTVKQP
jgi:phosphoribosylaminoimidazole-succinocarboxamide synthase